MNKVMVLNKKDSKNHVCAGDSMKPKLAGSKIMYGARSLAA